MLDTPTATLDAAARAPSVRSLADRDEYGPITGRPGGLFTAATVLVLADIEALAHRLADWVPADHLL